MTKIIVLIILGLITISCGPRKYSEEVRRNFVSACEDNAVLLAGGDKVKAGAYCNCVLEGLEEKYDEKTFVKEETKLILGGTTSSEFGDDALDIAAGCAASKLR